MAGLTTAANTSHTGYSAPVSQAPVRNTSGPIEPVSDKTEGDNVVGTRRVIIIKCSGPRYAFLLTVVYNTDGEIDGLWAPSVTTGLLIISKSSLPPKKLPFPAFIFDGQLKTRHAPGTSFEPYPIPVLADPKKIIQALDRLRALKTFASADAVNTTTGPQLPKYISAAFGSLDKPWKPGYLRAPTEPSAAISSNQKTRPTTSSSPRSSATSSWDLMHRFPWGNPVRISMSFDG